MKTGRRYLRRADTPYQCGRIQQQLEPISVVVFTLQLAYLWVKRGDFRRRCRCAADRKLPLDVSFALAARWLTLNEYPIR